MPGATLPPCFFFGIERLQGTPQRARMPRIPIFKLGHGPDQFDRPVISSYTPQLTLEGLSAGVDNLRHDVYLSPKFVEQMRLQIARLIARHGDVERVLTSDTPTFATAGRAFGNLKPAQARMKSEPAEIKTLLTKLQVAALSGAKAEDDFSVDLLARLAVIKFLRAELVGQFAQVLERCRITLRSYEGIRQHTGLELRERVAAFQVGKKAVLRKAGQDLFQSLQEIEKETLARMRRSLFGDTPGTDYRLFINRLVFTDDGRDDYINADHYVMLGNWDRDPDRFPQMREVAGSFLQSLDLGPAAKDPGAVDGWLNSADSLFAAVGRVSGCHGPDRAKIAGRFLRDFLRYHRDLRRLEALNSALDSVNLIGNEKLRELSSVNGTLYEFLLPDEQRPTEEKVLHHVIIKADIRDSTRLTRSLMDRGLNPASYFSLNFFEPVYKLLPKYKAMKVFLEGDAMILALLEKEGEPELAVSRACVLAREMLDIVRGYNHLLERAGLPPLELGIGISYQDSAPLYLMAGEQRIMISDALNESDRLHSGLVAVGSDIFRKIVVRESQIPQIDPRNSSFKGWTDRAYYEVCSNPAIYAMLGEEGAAGV